MKVKVSISIGLVGCHNSWIVDVGDVEGMDMLDKEAQINDAVHEWLWQCNGPDISWEEIEAQPDATPTVGK